MGQRQLCSAVLVVLGAAYTVKYNQVVAKFAAKLEKDAQEAAASASVSASAPSGASGEEEAERLKAEGEFVFVPACTAWHVEVQGGVIRVCVCVRQQKLGVIVFGVGMQSVDCGRVIFARCL